MYIDQNTNRLMADNGEPFNLHDYLSIKPVYKPIHDYNTKNSSFINIYLLLKQLGVKNCDEHLQLFDSSLLGVDPHDPNLPNNVRMKIDKECRRNLWYYLREVVRVPLGDKMGYFDLNIGSFTVTWLITRRQNFFYEISRQIGKTFLLTTIMGWVLIFGGQGIKMANMHHSAEPAVNNLNMVKSSLDFIPEYLQYHKKEFHKKDPKTGLMKVKNVLTKSDNARTLENKIFRNRINTVIVGGSRVSANKAGRGATRNIYLIDEIPHIKFNNVAFGALNQSTSKARELARKAGIPYGIWLLGTPGDLDTPEGRWMYNLVEREYIPFGFEDVELFDYTEDQLNEYLNKRSISNFWHVKYDWKVLGFKEEWFFDKNRNEEVSGIRTEVLLNWEKQAKDSPFTRAELAALDQKSRDHDIVIDKYDDYNSFYLYPRKGESCNTLEDFLYFNFRDGFVIGVDVADGVGLDSSAMTIVDAKTLRVIATYDNNKIDTEDLSLLIVSILERIVIPRNLKCAIQIERNKAGTSVLARIKKFTHLQKYLIKYPVGESKANDLNRVVDFTDLNGKRFDFGFNVTPGTRKIFTEDLLMTLVKKHTEVYSVPKIVDEVRGLVRKNRLGTVRIEHSDASHDDIIFSSLHAYYPLYHAAEILRRAHGIIVDPSQWILSEGVEVLANTNYQSRITTRYITDDRGNFAIKYYDRATDKYVTETQAREIQELEKKEGFNSAINKEVQESMRNREEAKKFASFVNEEYEAPLPDVLFDEEIKEMQKKQAGGFMYSIYSQNTLNRTW